MDSADESLALVRPSVSCRKLAEHSKMSTLNNVTSKCCGESSISSTSKGLVIILLWNIIVGLIYGTVQCLGVAVSLGPHDQSATYTEKSFKFSIYIILSGFGLLALCQIFLFPISGLMADIWYGRYKVITVSVILITMGCLIFSVMAILYLVTNNPFQTYISLMAVSLVFLLLGFSGFQSNAVQFGLDQLVDAPSKDLSSFLHWYVWTNNLGEMIARIIGSAAFCNIRIQYFIGILPLLFAASAVVLLVVSGCKHYWFRREPKTQNPYGLVYTVLKFVVKREKPLRPRSALTYCDDIMPSRMDLAKHKYGGPFTTEVVEDVKTFLRILIMLLLICPIFYYHISASNLYPIYALHMGKSIPVTISGCDSDWMLFQSGILAYIVSFIVTPMYTFFLPRIIKWLPQLLHRLWCGIVFMVLCVFLMWLLYVFGLYRAEHDTVNSTCIFFAEVRNTSGFTPTLDFPTATLLVPNILAGIAIPIINISIFEFLSAQSPHTMKGLLFGVFYAFRGFFILLGCLAVFPFTAHVFEKASHHYPLLECGFFYYTFNMFLGAACLAIIMLASRWYRYREREDKPYDHTYVENYYHRYVGWGRARGNTISEEEDSLPQANSGTNYSHGYACKSKDKDASKAHYSMFKYGSINCY